MATTVREELFEQQAEAWGQCDARLTTLERHAPKVSESPADVPSDTIRMTFDTRSLSDYEMFLAVKRLPRYRFSPHGCEFPAEYASRLGLSGTIATSAAYRPTSGLFDYQQHIAETAIRKKKFAAFVAPGLGKTFIESEFARHAKSQLGSGRSVLIVAPPMVVPQSLEEIDKFYRGGLPIERVTAKGLGRWLHDPASGIGITNYEALKDDLQPGRLGALILDESSMLKSAYGKWAQTCIRLGKGLEWKLCGTGTPAPNDRIEYANHAVFLDAFPTVNSFLARFFINKGQTNNRWEMKPHALRAFYDALSHWSVFLNDPASYGWKDNAGTLPPINVHIHDVELSAEQKGIATEVTGTLFADHVGGITGRTTLSQLAKGRFKGRDVLTKKPAFIRKLVDSWPAESTLIWCLYNREQEQLERAIPEAASIKGETPFDQRMQFIADFKAGRRRVLITKPEILGFGLNLHICTRQVFSGLQDSYEEFYQAVKRSNRVGSTLPLNVHIPVTPIERPMVDTVLAKAKRVQSDAAEQERMYRDALRIAA